jgi:hypothetical protein
LSGKPKKGKRRPSPPKDKEEKRESSEDLVKPPRPDEEGWAEWYSTLPICEEGQDQWPAK